MIKTIIERAEELRHRITRHDQLYYALQAPEISDRQYDELYQALQALEREHPECRDPDSPTQRVGGEVAAGFTQVEHPEPMLSLGNVSSEEEFMTWHRRMADWVRTSRFPMSAELKIDGIAVRLIYEGGRLRTGATRGDGQTGEGRDPHHPHRPQHPTGPDRVGRPARPGQRGGPGRDLHAPLRLRPGEPRESGKRGIYLRQPKERRRGRGTPAGPQGGRRTRAHGLGLLSWPTGHRQPPDELGRTERVGAAGQSGQPALLLSRRGHLLLPSDAGATRPARLRDRRHRCQDGPSAAPTDAGRHRARTPLGDSLEVSLRADHHQADANPDQAMGGSAGSLRSPCWSRSRWAE